MKNKAIAFLLFLLPFFSFSPKGSNKWVATMELKRKDKTYILRSDAVFGGISDPEKRIFMFGKNHMFTNPQLPEIQKIFNDLCITNASGQFEMELEGPEVQSSYKGEKQINGFISMKKKTAVSFLFSGKETNKKVSLKSTFSHLGFTLTDEAKVKFADEFTLTFTEINL